VICTPADDATQFSAAPEPRPPQPITPTRSVGEAWAQTRFAPALASVKPPTVSAVFCTKARRVTPDLFAMSRPPVPVRCSVTPLVVPVKVPAA
jgi:hypothetical protein